MLYIFLYLIAPIFIFLLGMAWAEPAKANKSETAGNGDKKKRAEMMQMKAKYQKRIDELERANAEKHKVTVRWRAFNDDAGPGVDAVIYPGCTDIYFHTDHEVGGSPRAPIALEVQVLRPDGSLAQTLPILATGPNKAEAKLGGKAIRSMLADSGEWNFKLMNAATGKRLSNRRISVLNLSAALAQHDASLAVSVIGSGNIKLYSMAGTARFDVKLDWNERVPRSKYQQIAVGLMAAHRETSTVFPIHTWYLAPEERTWSFYLDYPIAGLGPGNWGFALQIGDTPLATAGMVLRTPEQVFEQIKLAKVRLKVKKKEGGDTFLEGSRVQLSQHRAVSPVVSLHIPCTVPEHKLTVRFVVCRDGVPLLGSAGEVPAKEGVSDISFVPFALPEDRGDGQCLSYEIAVFVEGRFVKSWPFEAISEEKAGP